MTRRPQTNITETVATTYYVRSSVLSGYVIEGGPSNELKLGLAEYEERYHEFFYGTGGGKTLAIPRTAANSH